MERTPSNEGVGRGAAQSEAASAAVSPMAKTREAIRGATPVETPAATVMGRADRGVSLEVVKGEAGRSAAQAGTASMAVEPQRKPRKW